MHFEQSGNPFVFVFGRVDQRGAFGKLPAIDADESELADVRVGHDLECKSGKRAAVAWNEFDHLIGIQFMPFDRASVNRRGHPTDDGVEDLLNSLVFKGSPAEDRIELVGNDPFADDFLIELDVA